MTEQEKITPAKMMLIGVGWMGVQFFWALHSGSLPLFLRNFTEKKSNISLVISLAGVAGLIIPPVIGNMSDRVRTRFGRRRPFIFVGILGVFLCIICLPQLTTFLAVAMVAGVMYSALRVAETPYLSLLPDVTPPEQRSTASGVMNLFGSIGLILCFVMSNAIWGKNPHLVFYLVAIICLGCITITLAFIKEPDALEAESAKGDSLPDYIAGVLKETNVMTFFAAQIFWWLGFWMVTSFATLFVTEELGVAEEKSFLVLAVFAVTSTIFVLPLGILGDKFGRKGILSILVAGWAVSEFLVGFSQTFLHALLLVGSTAIPFAGIMGVGLAYFLDLIPKERTAEFMGISILSIAISQIAGPIIGGVLIDTVGYRSIFPTAGFFMFVGLIILQFVKPRAHIEELPEIP